MSPVLTLVHSQKTPTRAPRAPWEAFVLSLMRQAIRIQMLTLNYSLSVWEEIYQQEEK
jgi:hypothetical protein